MQFLLYKLSRKLFVQSVVKFDPHFLTPWLSRKWILNQNWGSLEAWMIYTGTGHSKASCLLVHLLWQDLDLSPFECRTRSWSILSAEVWPFSRRLQGNRFGVPALYRVLRSLNHIWIWGATPYLYSLCSKFHLLQYPPRFSHPTGGLPPAVHSKNSEFWKHKPGSEVIFRLGCAAQTLSDRGTWRSLPFLVGRNTE